MARVAKLTLAWFGVALAGEVPVDVELDASLIVDDECVDDGSGTCSLNAVQLRAHRAAAEAAAKAAAAKPAEDEAAKPAEAWKQCGGQKWSGTTSCVEHTKCTEVDQWYSQCVPDGSAAPAPAPQLQAAPQHHHFSGHMEPLAAQAPLPDPPKTRSTPPILIKGNFLYDSATGKRFFAKGVAYNPRNMVFDIRQMKKGNCTPGDPPVGQLAYAADPTSDELEGTWKEALDAMADMGANTIRLYNIDPEISHKKFMDYASSLGIYVIVPLTRHDWGYLPAGMPSPQCYTAERDEYGNVGTNLLVSAKLIVKQFSQYDNVLMFTVANELTVAEKNGYAAFPCVKALTRDIHRYQQECAKHMRRIPLIYADMDMGPPYREMVGRYMSCALESEDDAVDAYGLNVYSWCDKEYPDETGENNFGWSPYGPIRDEFQSFAKPLLFTEFGCNLGEFQTYCPYKGGRTWPDVKTFFNEFKEIMSGAVAFEFSMEDNQYGITMSPGFVSDKHNAKHFYLLDSYFSLKKEFNAHNVSTKWDGAKATSCGWTPDKAHKMSHAHHVQKCPSTDEVQKLFDDKRLDFDPNWDSLPPKPKGADQDALAYCPNYKVDKTMYTEGCCHMKC